MCTFIIIRIKMFLCCSKVRSDQFQTTFLMNVCSQGKLAGTLISKLLIKLVFLLKILSLENTVIYPFETEIVEVTETKVFKSEELKLLFDKP